MIFGSDDRGDLSGVPRDLLDGRTAANRPSQQSQRSPFWSMFRAAVWLCFAMVIGLAVAFVVYRLPGLFGPVPSEQGATETVSQPQTEVADEQVGQAQDSYAVAMRDAATASDLAQRQHAQAMKAVEAARALAKNPDSREAKDALDKAMREVQAMSQ